MGFGIFVALIALVISLAYIWIRRRYSTFERSGFLHEKPSFPFGNLKGIGRTTHMAYVLKKLYDEFKGKAPAFGIYFFVAPAVVITDLETIKNVLIRDFDTFHNRGIYFNEKDDPLSAHIVAIEDDAWRKMRTKMTPTFTSGKMKMIFETVIGISDLMIRQLKEEKNLESIEVREILAKFMTDVIGNVAFGLELNSISDLDSTFRKMSNKLFDQGPNFQLKIFFMSAFRNFARKMGMRFVPSDVSDFFLKSISDTVDYRLKNNIQRNDFMDLLLKIRDKDDENKGKLTLLEISAQCFVFFAAGFETSSSTSSFVLYNLATHQDTQDKLRNEIKTTLAKHGEVITYDGMQEMKYLQMVIDETLRLYGPFAQLFRTAARDYQIPGSKLVIPEGSMTFIPVYAIHMDPDIYPEPEKFNPDRFSEENKRNRHPMAYLPFGEGPRNCIGMRFGLMQTKLALIQILLNFKLSTTSRTLIPMKFDNKQFFPEVPGGTWLKLEKLN